MIVRIMGEGQLDLSEADMDLLNSVDTTLEQAIDSGDEASFREALDSLLAKVREHGKPLALDSLESSDFVLPPADASMDEVKEMLGDEGLIPDVS
ncbi:MULTISPECIES: PspA-associated protein PspAA [Nocardiopsis]|uniref:PspA-associated protein PspAA n=1 Tax=Nocardiopsis TaxID=2013 RepID=UPI00034C1B29|nr:MULTISPECIES: hypothetical protein [Nocardiopsis]